MQWFVTEQVRRYSNNDDLHHLCICASLIYDELIFATTDITSLFYLWLSMVSANERKCYICNILPHWLRPCSTTYRQQDEIAKKHQEFIKS